MSEISKIEHPQQRWSTDLLSLPIENHNGVDYRVKTTKHKGYKEKYCDCDAVCECWIPPWVSTAFRNVKFDGTNKAFYSKPHTPRDYKLNPYIGSF